jgi:hypothetical protein
MSPADDTLAHSLLSDLADSHVLVLHGPLDVDGDLLTAAWQAARDDAYDAYDAWLGAGGYDEFIVYRAAADREEAAAAALAAGADSRHSLWQRDTPADDSR